MGIVGSVLDTQTVTANTPTALSVGFPTSNLQVVGIFIGVTYCTIPLTPGKNAVLFQTGGQENTYPARVSTMMRRVNMTVEGQSLNYTVYTGATTSVMVWYYGTPLEGGQDITDFTGVLATITLGTGGTGTATLNFPSGNLVLTGLTASFGYIASGSTALSFVFNTAPGQSISAWITGRLLSTASGANSDIIPVDDIPLSSSMTVDVADGVATDIVSIVAYYK